VPRVILPFGSEFSPSQVDLSYLLELAFEMGGDGRGLEASVWTMYFEDYSKRHVFLVGKGGYFSLWVANK
jgi:hypothetical protein